MENSTILHSNFDAIAETYDKDFSNSKSGLIQRNKVHQLIEPLLKTSKKNILEINCGTGIDAKFISSFGHQITATDGSQKMIDVAKIKFNNEALINFQKANFHELTTLLKNQKFDLVFSNFGGLNCIDENEFKVLIEDLHAILNQNGRLVFIIMPDRYIWDWLYFTLKLDFKKANRRAFPTTIQLNENSQNTWYYNSSIIKEIVGNKFIIKKIKPIGQLIPPTHLENKLKLLFPILSKLENISQYLLPPDLADHTYFELERQQ